MMVGGNIVKGEWAKGVLTKKTNMTEKDWDKKMTEIESKPGVMRIDAEHETWKIPEIINEAEAD